MRGVNKHQPNFFFYFLLPVRVSQWEEVVLFFIPPYFFFILFFFFLRVGLVRATQKRVDCMNVTRLITPRGPHANVMVLLP